METRRLGNSDLDLSVIGLGTWAIGGDWFMGWGPQKENVSIRTIHEALDLGINWIDTAAVYGFGKSEEMVGRALAQSKKSVIVATKCGLTKEVKGGVNPCLKKESIFLEVEKSLKRLQRDTIDLYQIHWPKPEEDIEEGFEALLQLKEQGKIRWAGVSNFNIKQLERISALGTITSLQPPYNLLKREIEQDILPWCAAHHVGLITYSPMECGLLTGKLSKAWIESLPASDWRKARWDRLREINYFAEPELSGLVSWVQELSNIAARHDRPVSHLAISWVLRRKEITAAIVGARNKGQIAETVHAAEFKLSTSEIEEIETSYLAYMKRMGREKL